MRVPSRRLIFGGALMCALVLALLTPRSAVAEPKGWKCSYKVEPLSGGPFMLDTGPYYYACFGRNLRETRARARARCRELPWCTTGACLPLDFTPRSSCEQD